MVAKCPKCGRTLNAPDEAVGKRGRCIGCGEVFVIGLMAPEPPSAIDLAAVPSTTDFVAAAIPAGSSSPRVVPPKAPEKEPLAYWFLDRGLTLVFAGCVIGFLAGLLGLVGPVLANPQGRAPDSYPGNAFAVMGWSLFYLLVACAGFVLMDVGRQMRRLNTKADHDVAS